MPSKDSIVSDLTFVINFLGNFIQNNEPPFGLDNGASKKAADFTEQFVKMKTQIFSFQLPSADAAESLLTQVLHFLEHDPVMEFYRSGYSGTYHRDGADAISAPSSPSGEELYIVSVAQCLRRIVDSIIEICRVVDDTQAQCWNTVHQAVALPERPQAPPRPTQRERKIYKTLNSYERFLTSLNSAQEIFERRNLTSRPNQSSIPDYRTIFSRVQNCFMSFIQASDKIEQISLCHRLLGFALLDLQLYCHASANFLEGNASAFTELKDYYEAIQLFLELSQGRLSPERQIDFSTKIPLLSFKDRAQADQRLPVNITSLLEVAKHITPEVALLANPHWTGLGSQKKYQEVTPRLSNMKAYDI